jgi:hypothetical protein
MLTLSPSELLVAGAGAVLALLIGLVGWGLRRILDDIVKKLDKVVTDNEANKADIVKLREIVAVHEFRLQSLDGKGSSTPKAA